jgi:class 3 adenylate cyclase
MADRVVKLRVLKKILRRYGVRILKRRGKGSHLVFARDLPTGTFTYPVPNRADVLIAYVVGCRRRFALSEADGVSDAEFYG